VFSTAADNQPSVEVHVLQGERTEARDNRTLGKFHLEGIMPAPRGVPQGRGHVRHRRERHPLGPRASTRPRARTRRSPSRRTRASTEADIQRMVKEASEHEAEDKERREQVERRNKLDSLCYTMEKTISENKEKLVGTDIATLESLIKDGRAAVEKQDDAQVKDVLDKLETRGRRAALCAIVSKVSKP
jgi:molecular chaperone DnaK